MSTIFAPNNFDGSKLSRVVIVGVTMFACGTIAGLKLAPVAVAHAQTSAEVTALFRGTLSAQVNDPADGVLGEPYHWDH